MAPAQRTPAETPSSGRAPSRAGRHRNAHVSLFWPNQFRREAEATQTSLAPRLCSSLIIALLLHIACAKTWALLEPLVAPSPARDGEREKEGMRSTNFPLFGWGHRAKATAKLPASACARREGSTHGATPGKAPTWCRG